MDRRLERLRERRLRRGSAVPPTCGAVYTVGDVEGKTLLARYDATTGALLGCQSANIFPYSGGENYSAVLSASSFVYAAGGERPAGSATDVPAVEVRWFRRGAGYGGRAGTNFSGYSCYGGSSSRGLALLTATCMLREGAISPAKTACCARF